MRDQIKASAVAWATVGAALLADADGAPCDIGRLVGRIGVNVLMLAWLEAAHLWHFALQLLDHPQ